MACENSYKLWGGCFDEEPSSVLRRLNDSLPVDSRLYRQDIRGSRAWARELHRSQHLSVDDFHAIEKGLDIVEKELASELNRDGRLNDKEEDIHSVVEQRLRKHAGDAALRLHTARSRNDQSATDTRLWMLENLPRVRSAIADLIQSLVNRANAEINIIAPGYTHMQRAQPIRWSHFLLCHAWALRDDCLRLNDQLVRVSISPLGSGALAGCALAIDRERVAADLGFGGVTPNSMYGVSTRDHIVEFLNTSSLCGIHLSRLAEDLIIYSSQEFGFVTFSDQFSTGSSLMPQKRNPDGLELVRGSAGLLLGDSFGFNCVLKSLPSTYNKDLQSDKELLFRSYDKLLECIKVTIGSVGTMKVNAEKALSALEPNMLATDVAHFLVRRGVAFRDAHHLVGAALKRAAARREDLRTMPHHEYLQISPEFGTEEELKSVFSWESSVEQYTSTGGTARAAVYRQIDDLNLWLSQN